MTNMQRKNTIAPSDLEDIAATVETLVSAEALPDDSTHSGNLDNLVLVIEREARGIAAFGADIHTSLGKIRPRVILSPDLLVLGQRLVLCLDYQDAQGTRSRLLHASGRGPVQRLDAGDRLLHWPTLDPEFHAIDDHRCPPLPTEMMKRRDAVAAKGEHYHLTSGHKETG